MNQQLFSLSFLLVAVSAGAQAPANPSVPLPGASEATVTSRVSRYVAGPGDRPQGLLLRNGTFVALSPALAQRMPESSSKSASVQVTGEEFTYSGSKTIQARTITLAGVSYTDDGPAGRAPGIASPAGDPPPPPPPPRAPRMARPGPPPPCGAPAPPPPPAPASAVPPPPGAGSPPSGPGVAAPPPPPDGAMPAPPPAPLTSPASGPQGN